MDKVREEKEAQYQQWLTQNREFITKFIAENVKLDINFTSRSGYQDCYEIEMSIEDYGVFSYNTIHLSE